jgi:hypothetical protein
LSSCEIPLAGVNEYENSLHIWRETEAKFLAVLQLVLQVTTDNVSGIVKASKLWQNRFNPFPHCFARNRFHKSIKSYKMAIKQRIIKHLFIVACTHKSNKL